MNFRDPLKLEVFKQFAVGLADLSCCKKKSVGCIIYPKDYSRVLSIGYNGPPRSLPNNSCTAEDYCGCVHAETNALIKLGVVQESLTLLCTLSPCERCARLIINAGCIDQVLYIVEHNNIKGLELFSKVGISYAQI